MKKWLLGCLCVPVLAQADLILLDKDQWRLTLSGFVEADWIQDSTRSFREVVGNGPVQRGDTLGGGYGRTLLSGRNSRVAVNVEPPPIHDWKARGYIEADFLGFDPSPGPNNSEYVATSQPTLRLRHAFFLLEKNNWQILAGQTWQLFGWQPLHFVHAADVPPVPASLFARGEQLRVTTTWPVAEAHSLIAAAALGRPPQADGGMPDLQAGLRWTDSARKAGFLSVSIGRYEAQPMGVGVSGLYRQFVVPNWTANTGASRLHGSAVAVDAILPIVPPPDAKNLNGALTLAGEWSSGQGYGDQFNSWTGGMASPSLSASTVTGYPKPALDPGIGDYDGGHTFQLARIISYNLQLQYHWPVSVPVWTTVGAGLLASPNMASLVSAGSLSTSGATTIYDRERMLIANLFAQATPQIRLGLEYLFVESRYGDGAVATNNRFQLTSLFIF